MLTIGDLGINESIAVIGSMNSGILIDVDAEVLGKRGIDESMVFIRPVEFGKVGKSTGLLLTFLPINGNVTLVVEIDFWALVQGIKGR